MSLSWSMLIISFFLEPCALHLDLFINELKQLPMLHDCACDMSQENKVNASAESLAMP